MERMKSATALAMAAGMILLVLTTGCIDEEGESRLEITDQMGELLELEKKPERIVALAPSLCEIVIALDAGDLLVGADSASVTEFPDLEMESVATWEGLDSEKLLSTTPDLVLMDKNLDITEENYNSITALSIPVYRAFPNDLNEVMSMILDIGKILDKEEKAVSVTDEIISRKDAITVSLEDVHINERPSVLYVTYYDGIKDPYVGTSSSFSGDLIEMAGGVNCIIDSSEVGTQISVERIIEANPDVIITSQSTVWPTNSRSTILSAESWKDITAVKNGAVYDVNGNLIDRTGPYLIDGIETLNSLLYP